jgi:hypothetical protein
MNAITACGRGLPATEIIRLSPHTELRTSCRVQAGAETVLAGVRYPPRAAEARPLSELLHEVLAAYGLADQAEFREAAERFDAVA